MKLDKNKLDEIFIGIAIVLLSAGILGVFTNYSLIDSIVIFGIGLFFAIISVKER